MVAEVYGQPDHSYQDLLLAADTVRARLAVEPDGAAAKAVHEPRELLVELGEHHLDHRQRTLVGDSQAALAPRLDAGLPEHLVDAPAAPVDDDRLHPDETQERDVAGESRLERGIHHRGPAEADHERRSVEGADVGERLCEDAGFLGGQHWDHASSARSR